MTLPDLSTPLTVGALTFWMVLLAIKHVVADFLLQNAWIATKDAKNGWALPLTVHCAIHGALTTAIFGLFAPKLWILGLADFVIHFAIDRAKGYCVARFDITQQSSWFWWLIGIDQALHHLTGFGFSLVAAAN